MLTNAKKIPGGQGKIGIPPRWISHQQKGLIFLLLSHAWEKLAEEMIHHSTCSAGTGLCALLLGLCVSMQRSCSPIPHLQFLLVVDNFADSNPYLPFHPEHSVPVSYRIQGGMRYGCVSWLCPAPWTECMSEAGCFLKPLVWDGPTSQIYPFCWA